MWLSANAAFILNLFLTLHWTTNKSSQQKSNFKDQITLYFFMLTYGLDKYRGLQVALGPRVWDELMITFYIKLDTDSSKIKIYAVSWTLFQWFSSRTHLMICKNIIHVGFAKALAWARAVQIREHGDLFEGAHPLFPPSCYSGDNFEYCHLELLLSVCTGLSTVYRKS